MTDGPVVEVIGFDHLVLVVADVERSLEWYTHRSEERRVGKESRSRWSPYH